jgi:hypothetical protein
VKGAVILTCTGVSSRECSSIPFLSTVVSEERDSRETGSSGSFVGGRVPRGAADEPFSTACFFARAFTFFF